LLGEISGKKIDVNSTILDELLFNCHQISTSGYIKKKQFLKILEQLNITDPLIVETLINTFDPRKASRIDAREFICGLATIASDIDNNYKLSLLFKCYDWDSSGTLNESEILKLLQSVSKVFKRRKLKLLPLLKKLFDGKPTINEEEFINKVLKCKELSWLIKPVQINNDQLH